MRKARIMKRCLIVSVFVSLLLSFVTGSTFTEKYFAAKEQQEIDELFSNQAGTEPILKQSAIDDVWNLTKSLQKNEVKLDLTFIGTIFTLIGDIIYYIFSTELWDLPQKIAYLCLIGGISYGITTFVIYFPISIVEAILKKKAPEKITNKIQLAAGIILYIIMLIALVEAELH